MKTIQNSVSLFFVVAVAILSVVSVFGIWDIFGRDVIGKSFQTLGLLAVVAVVIMIAGKFVNNGSDPAQVVEVLPNPIFKSIRKATLAILIVSAALLALLGVCAIWELITDKSIIYKSMSSLGVLAFSSFVIVMTCLEREGNKVLGSGKKSPIGSIATLVFIIYILFVFGALFV